MGKPMTTVTGTEGCTARVLHPDGAMTVVIYGDGYTATTTLSAEQIHHMRRQGMGRRAADPEEGAHG